MDREPLARQQLAALPRLPVADADVADQVVVVLRVREEAAVGGDGGQPRHRGAVGVDQRPRVARGRDLVEVARLGAGIVDLDPQGAVRRPAQEARGLPRHQFHGLAVQLPHEEMVLVARRTAPVEDPLVRREVAHRPDGVLRRPGELDRRAAGHRQGIGVGSAVRIHRDQHLAAVGRERQARDGGGEPGREGGGGEEERKREKQEEGAAHGWGW